MNYPLIYPVDFIIKKKTLKLTLHRTEDKNNETKNCQYQLVFSKMGLDSSKKREAVNGPGLLMNSFWAPYQKGGTRNLHLVRLTTYYWLKIIIARSLCFLLDNMFALVCDLNTIQGIAVILNLQCSVARNIWKFIQELILGYRHRYSSKALRVMLCCTYLLL